MFGSALYIIPKNMLIKLQTYNSQLCRHISLRPTTDSDNKNYCLLKQQAHQAIDESQRLCQIEFPINNSYC